MHIEKQFRELENIEEIRAYNISNIDLFEIVPQYQKPIKIPFCNIIKYVQSDVNMFIPIDDGEDFVINRLGWNILQRGNINLEDVEGRRLSECSPFFYEILKESFKEVYETKKTKAMRIYYYISDKIKTITNIHIIFEENNLFLISDYNDEFANKKTEEEQILEDNAEKSTLIEYFSHTGSYYMTNNEFTWTQGIYNIINRNRESSDSFYNIIFDLVIPEDKPLVQELIKTMSPETDTYENIIRIKTWDGTIKYLDTYLYSKFDENGDLISHYGLFKDVSLDSHKHKTRPVDFMLNGFKYNSRLSLLIEPLSRRYEFSEGFYDMIEIPSNEYIHSREIIDNIVEPEVRENIMKLINGEIDELNEILTFKVHGNEDNLKICELFIERFKYGNNEHSIGFLTDITNIKKKQEELIESNANKNILIKEVHHRVKNNLQVLNSFLNLERRAYKDDPNTILDNMQARLSSLALLHEKTYNTTDFLNINLKNYMEDQDKTLQGLFSAKKITFKSDIDENINLSIETITPLLLIVDELTMNAIKHAFPDPDMENKTISKTIKLMDENKCEFILKDNGVGLESPEQLINHNLGWEIVNSLTKQLDGSIEIMDPKVGTEFRIVFPTKFEDAGETEDNGGN
ncbi:histidine kinase dimerization/phosphoacceptor domain -containing protein [uncultured Methanobrevibacter sp.]|uniref:histidine kinase dimerization/phosphoacceptor domain -containing protein n=1 Tax=uncultured Methanobrevibacter sp. TaxID=253161 RepID=UPI0025FB0B01|nr:histidine kinase dimerization/phosphoacceptor domain -containing protein [uncultured Methanobrevibacter sp.]